MTTALSPPARRRLPRCPRPPEPSFVTGTVLDLLAFHRHCFVIPAQAGI